MDFTHEQDDDPEEVIPPKHWYAQERAVRGEIARSIFIFGISVHILDMDGPTLQGGAGSYCLPSWTNWVTLNEIYMRC
jgi:hypothetical protein